MRSGNHSTDSLLVGIDHLQVAASLVASEEPAQARMALILLDSLVEAILFRRISSLLEFVDEGWWYRERMPQYSAKTRKKIRQDFDTRLRVAAPHTYLDEWTGQTGPFISKHDQAVIRITHTYRNAAYHRDFHNPATIGVFARLAIVSAASLFARGQKSGWRYGITDEKRVLLAERGVQLQGEWLDAGEVASKVQDELRARFAQTADEIREAFIDDLEWRFSNVEELLHFLKSDGQQPVDEAIAWFEFYDRWGSDDEILLEITDKMDPLSRAKREGLEAVPEEYVRQARDAPGEYFARRKQLMKEHPPTVSVATLANARRMAERFAGMTRIDQLVALYHQIDGDLSRLERYVGAAAESLDRAIQLAIDVARGK
jgi:hypothetical protein